jgi:hypothetical protein
MVGSDRRWEAVRSRYEVTNMRSQKVAEHNIAVDESRRRALAVGAGTLLGSSLLSAPAQAAVTNIPAVGTSLSSGSDRMISYRFQSRMWQTADGGTHLIINRGPLSPDASLVLYSSFDNGRTWLAALALQQTNFGSTVDGYLDGNTLRVVFSNSTGGINYLALTYDPATRVWTRKRIEPVFAVAGLVASSPAFVVDNAGAGWCCYSVQDTATLKWSLRMSFRSPGDNPWRDSEQTFGDTESQNSERAGRPVKLPTGVGLVYTDQKIIAWATRADGAPMRSPWTDTTVLLTTPPEGDGRGPYGGHFSVLTDPLGNLHLVTVDMTRIVYFRFLQSTQQWDPIRALTTPVFAIYVQITYCDGNLVVIGNANEQLQVIQSTDLGNTFAKTHLLTHPKATGSQDFANARME